MKIAITGANSRVGENLISHFCAFPEEVEIIAGVRSPSALTGLPDHPRIRPAILNYQDSASLAEALAGARCVIHLAGVLLAPPGTSYREANFESTRAVARAAASVGAEHLIFVSVVGADAHSANSYFRSKGEAEEALKHEGISVTVIRTPLLLGPQTAGGRALRAMGSQPRVRLLGSGQQLVQPLDVDDLSKAILSCCKQPKQSYQLYELVGPERLCYRELVERAATLMNNSPLFSSAPVWLARLGSAVASRIKGGGMTPTVIEVITSDEIVGENADCALGIGLTPLNETLAKIMQDGDAP